MSDEFPGKLWEASEVTSLQLIKKHFLFSVDNHNKSPANKEVLVHIT